MPEPATPAAVPPDILAAAVDAVRERYRTSTSDERDNRIAFVAGDVRAALEAVYPAIRAETAAAERELLTQAEDALHSVALRLLAVSPKLKEPYTDAPDLSPWSMSIGPQARRAHDLAQAIRKHLGLPFRNATRALGTPPLEVERVIAEAVAAERERMFTAIRHAIPLEVPWRGEALDLIAAAWADLLAGES